MTSGSADAADPEHPSTRNRTRWLWGIVTTFFVTAAYELAVHDFALINPPPNILRGAGVLAGLIFGAFAGSYLASHPKVKGGVRLVPMFLTLPLFGAAAGSYYVRLGYEISVFSGRDPTTYPQWVVVKEIRGSRRRAWGFSTTVSPVGGSREITVPIDQDLYSRLDLIATPAATACSLKDKHCRKVHVECASRQELAIRSSAHNIIALAARDQRQFATNPCFYRANLYRRPHSGRGLVPVAPFALHQYAKPDDSRRGFAIGAESAIGQIEGRKPCRFTSMSLSRVRT